MTINPTLRFHPPSHPIEIAKTALMKNNSSSTPKSRPTGKTTIIYSIVSASVSPLRVAARDTSTFKKITELIQHNKIKQNHKKFLTNCFTKKGATFSMVFLETGISLTAIKAYKDNTTNTNNIETKANIFGYFLGAISGACICPFTSNSSHNKSPISTTKIFPTLPIEFKKKFSVALARNSFSVPALTYQFSENPRINNLCGASLYVASRAIDLIGTMIIDKQSHNIFKRSFLGQLTTCFLGSFAYSYSVRTIADKLNKITIPKLPSPPPK